jgi:hypothetical protein
MAEPISNATYWMPSQHQSLRSGADTLPETDISSLLGKASFSRATGKSRLEASGRSLGDQPSDKRAARPGPSPSLQRACTFQESPGRR